MTRAVQNQPTPEVPAPPPAFAGPFKFTVLDKVPEPPAKTPTREPLPFIAYFDAFETDALEGRAGHFFVPCSFYKDRPGVKFEKVNPAYVQSKVRETFNKWRDAKPQRVLIRLEPFQRDGKDVGSKEEAERLGYEPEPGVSFWVLVRR